ncbi:hypothetical protein J7L05_08690 [bacterium]|nr:hypothetical protein [bacterium]
MPRKSFFLILSAIVLMAQFGIHPASAQENSESRKIKSRSLTGFYTTRMDFMSDDLIHGVVVEETKERKKKRLLPFLLWTAGAWITLDYINDKAGGGYQPVDEDEFFANLDLRCLERISDAKISLRQQRGRAMLADVVAVNMQTALDSQSGYPNHLEQKIHWRGEFLVGRLNPLYVSLANSGDNQTGVLAAGLNNLADGEIALIELYDDKIWYTIEIDNSDGDNLGVFRTTVDLDITNIHLSIEIIR